MGSSLQLSSSGETGESWPVNLYRPIFSSLLCLGDAGTAAALDSRHRELLKKQKELQEQYARLQQSAAAGRSRPIAMGVSALIGKNGAIHPAADDAAAQQKIIADDGEKSSAVVDVVTYPSEDRETDII